MPDLPDPRGVKNIPQGVRTYYAANKDPASPGTWTLAAELNFETLQGNSGPTPNLCVLRELPPSETGSAKRGAIAPNTEQAKTGNDATGTLFCGAHITVDSLVKVEAQAIGSSAWTVIFIGVVVKPEFDLDSCTILWHCEDYRHFMRKTVLYGRRVYDPDAGDPSVPVFIKGSRLTFNENDRPDRYQEGASLGDPDGSPASHDLPLFLPPDYNRLEDDRIPGGTKIGAAIPGGSGDNPWADYWLAGHVWNYLQDVYVGHVPAAIAHLSLSGFINWPVANQTKPEEGDPDYRWMFAYDGDFAELWIFVSDLALTGVSIDKAITVILQRCGPFDWTLVPNADGIHADIVPFNTHAGYGDPIDYAWGDYRSTVYESAPDVTGGKLFRDRTEFYNRGYAVGRKTVVETSLTTIADLNSDGAPESLIMDATDADTTSWLAAYKAGTSDAKKFPNVYRRFIVPMGFPWNEWVFSGLEVQNAIPRGALSSLMTKGWAFDQISGIAPCFQRLKPLVWRNREDPEDPPVWEPLPANIGVEVTFDSCGIWLSDNARTGKTPWVWDGNADDPTVYDLLVTLAVETDDLVSTSINDAGAGERAREYFMDGGNSYRPAMRINAYYNTDDGTTSGKITTNNSTYQPVKIGTPASPVKFNDRGTALDAELRYRMDMKNSVVITGTLPLWGMRIDPWPVGHLLGSLTVAGEDPTRPELNLNACIRGFRMTRNPPATVLTLDGR